VKFFKLLGYLISESQNSSTIISEIEANALYILKSLSPFRDSCVRAPVVKSGGNRALSIKYNHKIRA
jgi:hypothetical protein